VVTSQYKDILYCTATEGGEDNSLLLCVFSDFSDVFRFYIWNKCLNVTMKIVLWWD